MEIYEIKAKIIELDSKVEVIKKKVEYNNLIKEIKDDELAMNKEDFWDNPKSASLFSKKVNEKKNIIKDIDEIIKLFEDLKFLINNMIEEEDEIRNLYNLLKSKLSNMELIVLLNGEFDNENTYLEIHPGAGGVESHDFALMLLGMYEKYLSKNKDFSYKVIEYNKGEVAGIKSVLLEIKGKYAYGLLKNEMGVHRLIRISPFDSGNRRHTSFASVKVIPILDDIEFELDMNEVKIDTYRSSGAGGQSVNTTDSAVRLTHLPTNIVVTCQNERSQIQNKEQAIKILKTKLIIFEREKKKKETNEMVGDIQNNSFGSQKRTYTLHPYKLVKDNVSGCESTQAEKVLSGDIDKFIYQNLVNSK